MDATVPELGAIGTKWAALGMAGCALIIVDTCLNLRGLAKISRVHLEFACETLSIGG